MRKENKKMTAMLALAFALAVPVTVFADIYTCTNVDGDTEYRNMPCEVGDRQEIAPEKQPMIIPSVGGGGYGTGQGQDDEADAESDGSLPEKAWSAVSGVKMAAQAFMARWRLSGLHIVLLMYLLMSLVSFFTYRQDKRASQKKNARRVSESTLHWQEFLGGWPGAFAAQKIYRHKTVKPDYQFVFRVIVIVHILLWVDWALGFPVLGGLFPALR